MSENVTIGVLRHLHLQVLEGGTACRIAEENEGNGHVDAIIVSSLEDAIENLRQRLGLVVELVPGPAIPAKKPKRPRASCTDEQALAAASEMTGFTGVFLAGLDGVGPLRAERLIRKWHKAGRIEPKEGSDGVWWVVKRPV